MSFIDVGQGDGVLVQAGSEDYLVDAGRTEEGPDVVDFLRSRGVEKGSTASWLQIPGFHRTTVLGFNARCLEGLAQSSNPHLEIRPGGGDRSSTALEPTNKVPS